LILGTVRIYTGFTPSGQPTVDIREHLEKYYQNINIYLKNETDMNSVNINAYFRLLLASSRSLASDDWVAVFLQPFTQYLKTERVPFLH
jgi:hypothetical protein